jgi:alginate O-acetyltransferase complex protein AlgI
MLFNSINFAIFLPIIFFLYWFANKGKLKFQNVILLLASYFFYASWDYRFLFLLLFSSGLDFYTGIKIDSAQLKKHKKAWLFLSICINLGFLGLFKYYNFFAESFADALHLLGFKVSDFTLKLILPVGISFYTFHGLSYIIDIYNGKIKAERNVIDYAVFVSFFPLLVAGPIERATQLLPQLKVRRSFDVSKAINGLQQMLWGFFKKIVIADNCATYVNQIFANSESYDGSTLVIGAVFFAFQVYGDFSGYSDIAIGTARLFGIDLMKNFAYPFFSRNMAEFWRRWHISLSTWFRDYIYFPLGGNRGSTILQIRNVLIIFLLSGLWHGAAWTYILWGFLHALYVMPTVIFKVKNRYEDTVAHGRMLPNIKEIFQMLGTFGLFVFALTLFRSSNLSHAYQYISEIFSKSLFAYPQVLPSKLLLTILVFMTIEWIGREQEFAIETFHLKWPKPIRWAFYYSIVISIFYFYSSDQQFFYFQF